MPEATHQDDENSADDQFIEGETATVTISRMGPLASKTYEVDLDGGLPLGTVKQEAREKARADGCDVFHVATVNGKPLTMAGDAVDESWPEDRGPGGESA